MQAELFWTPDICCKLDKNCGTFSECSTNIVGQVPGNFNQNMLNVMGQIQNISKRCRRMTWSRFKWHVTQPERLEQILTNVKRICPVFVMQRSDPWSDIVEIEKLRKMVKDTKIQARFFNLHKCYSSVQNMKHEIGTWKVSAYSHEPDINHLRNKSRHLL